MILLNRLSVFLSGESGRGFLNHKSNDELLDNMKILIVDDNVSITKMFSKMLSMGEDYEIEVANNGYQAMDKMLSFHPEVVILDLAMPGMSGEETLAKIKEINPNTKVIIASAHADKKTIDFCLKNGASGYITKPCSSDDLFNSIKKVFTSDKYGKEENIFLRTLNEKLEQNFQKSFGENQRIEFQVSQLKKYPKAQNLDTRGVIKFDFDFKLPTFEIQFEQRGFTTEMEGKISGSIISVVPDKFLEMIQSFSRDGISIEGEDGVMEFFNIINGTVSNAIGDFLHDTIKRKPVRPFDIKIDKAVNNLDLMEINYTFELGDKNTWFTIYLWTDVFSSFERIEKLF